jgi:hypothetical protein
MNSKVPQEAELLLEKLFSGDSALREQALLAVDPKDRDGIRETVKVREDGCNLIGLLMEDLGAASGALRNNYTNQLCRRAAVRALAATVDGIIFSLKRLAVATAPVNGEKLDGEDLEFLTELSSQAGKKVRLPGFRDNLKRTFKLFAKVYRTSCSTDFGKDGFEALNQTYELRHRVMHPKLPTTFHISDDETKRAGEAIDWLSNELQRLLGDCQRSMGQSDST